MPEEIKSILRDEIHKAAKRRMYGVVFLAGITVMAILVLTYAVLSLSGVGSANQKLQEIAAQNRALSKANNRELLVEGKLILNLEEKVTQDTVLIQQLRDGIQILQNQLRTLGVSPVPIPIGTAPPSSTPSTTSTTAPRQSKTSPSTTSTTTTSTTAPRRQPPPPPCVLIVCIGN